MRRQSTGARGICWFYYIFLEPRRWKHALEGINAIVPVEDLILDGRIADTATCDNKALQLTRRELKGESLLAVRAYGAQSDQKALITLPGVTGPMVVIDCHTMEEIGKVSSQQPGFMIDVAKNHCRLLYVGTAEKWRERQ